MSLTVELVLDVKATLGEGPHWDHQKQQLYWVDILENKVHVYHPNKNQQQTIEFSEPIGAVIPKGDHQLMLAMKNGIHEYDLETETLRKIVDPEESLPDNRFNDAKCDPSGRLWAGTMDMDGKLGRGTLYRLDHDEKITPMITNVSISNGLAWSPDNKYFYYIDTPTKEVKVYHYQDDTGNISEMIKTIAIPEELGNPDGMTIDSKGMLWIAHWGGAKVTRWDPYEEQLLEIVEVPAKNVTSCTFGGENLTDLYITTASVGISDEDRKKYPFSGGLFKVKTNVSGMVANTYQK